MSGSLQLGKKYRLKYRYKTQKGRVTRKECVGTVIALAHDDHSGEDIVILSFGELRGYLPIIAVEEPIEVSKWVPNERPHEASKSSVGEVAVAVEPVTVLLPKEEDRA